MKHVTIKFNHHFVPHITGDIATVSAPEAERMIRYGYAELYRSPIEKDADELTKISDPDSLINDLTIITPAALVIVAKSIPAAPEDKSIHGPKNTKAVKGKKKK